MNPNPIRRAAAVRDPDALAPPSRSGLRRLAVRAEIALWLIAAVGLGAAGFGYADAALYQRRHADAEFARLELPPDEQTDGDRGPSRIGFLAPADGVPIARIDVPRLALTAVVAEGTTRSVLRRAVGRLPGSALPGEADNIALAAHRDTFFRPLENILPGDEVILESAAGRSSYIVEWTAIVDPDNIDVVGETGYPALTLVTCYPFRYVGNAPQRFVVRARRSDSPVDPNPPYSVSRQPATAMGG